ncbi:hypothetical protein GCM10010339_17110 [Streptomyces alanosinicus]|uniref:Uncharacterized protein n=1 Tax=Streptomyces alanosinicus TaxID=68171 RepID=A0A918YES1_9ACTN|nr:hypothetical protein GCM10010339_17110 [Streptomyces alanosinicus]
MSARQARIRVVTFFAEAAPLSLPAVDSTVTTASPERAASSVPPFRQAPLVRGMYDGLADGTVAPD